MDGDSNLQYVSRHERQTCFVTKWTNKVIEPIVLTRE